MEWSKHRLLLFVLACVAIEAVLFSIGNFKINKQVELEAKRVEEIKNALDATPILAKAISIYNITQSKKIYSKNDDVPMPLASLAKTMTVIVALNNHRLGDIISVNADAVKQSGDYGLFVGEKWKVEDLAKLTLISSANDGAYALASNTPNFPDIVNGKIQKIGLSNSSFSNFTGLDLDLENAGLPAQAGAFASAEEANTIAIYAIKAYPDIAGVTTKPEIILRSESGFIHKFQNTDILVGQVPNLLFSKTGFTDIAGGNLSIIFRNKKGESIAVTLLGSTFDGRFTDMEKIVEILYNS